jgi:hypothetical protein
MSIRRKARPLQNTVVGFHSDYDIQTSEPLYTQSEMNTQMENVMLGVQVMTKPKKVPTDPTPMWKDIDRLERVGGIISHYRRSNKHNTCPAFMMNKDPKHRVVHSLTRIRQDISTDANKKARFAERVRDLQTMADKSFVQTLSNFLGMDLRRDDPDYQTKRERIKMQNQMSYDSAVATLGIRSSSDVEQMFTMYCILSNEVSDSEHLKRSTPEGKNWNAHVTNEWILNSDEKRQETKNGTKNDRKRAKKIQHLEQQNRILQDACNHNHMHHHQHAIANGQHVSRHHHMPHHQHAIANGQHVSHRHHTPHLYSQPSSVPRPIGIRALSRAPLTIEAPRRPSLKRSKSYTSDDNKMDSSKFSRSASVAMTRP